MSISQKKCDQWVKRIAEGTRPGAVVLDAGAGECLYRPLFSHCDYRAQDLAQSPHMRYGDLDYIGDIARVQEAGETFDTILCIGVLEHIPHPIAAIQEMKRLLKRDGRLFIAAPQSSRIHQEPDHFYGGFTPFFYRYWLPAFGFDVEYIEPNCNTIEVWGIQEAAGMSAIVRKHNRLLWLLTLPIFRVFIPIMSYVLSRIVPDVTGPQGYFVKAKRKW